MFGGSDNTFSEMSSICRSASYMGLTKDDEESVVTIVVKKIKEAFVPKTGESNNIKSEKSPKETNKIYKFKVKNIVDECPNLAPKKDSFLSFDEIVKKVESKKR